MNILVDGDGLARHRQSH